MAFGELGKLLELVEKVVLVMERRDRLPDGMIKSDIGDLKRAIFEMKQRKEYE